MASTSSADKLESQIPPIMGSEVVNKTKEDDFQQTIELLLIDAEEISEEISHSVEEVSPFISCVFFEKVMRCVIADPCLLYVF